MTETLSPIDAAKYAAAKRAAEFVEDGMTVGLGTGSTAAWLVRCLGEKVAGGLRLTGVPTSTRTAEQARGVGIEIVTLDDAGWLDLTIDGADEFDDAFTLIKGGGGALLHEKIVAAASDRMVVIADASKEVSHLGAFPLPVEVIPFGWTATKQLIDEILPEFDVLGRKAVLRMGRDGAYRTDEGNFILDLHLGRIGHPRRLAVALNRVPGVVENGLFVDLCDTVVLGHGDGRVEVRDLATGGTEAGQIDLDDDNIFADAGDGR